MGRNNSDFEAGSGKFYHGTSETLAVGDHVLPPTDPRNVSPKAQWSRSWAEEQDDFNDEDREPYHEEMAWATTNLETAKGYGNNVYQVEHLDPQERSHDLNTANRLGGKEYHAGSLIGFRVIGQVK